jgi:hypothetical protein
MILKNTSIKKNKTMSKPLRKFKIIATYSNAETDIGTVNPEWGADPNNKYFVIKHGQILNK